jgi:YVTN family beta-propeller protein
MPTSMQCRHVCLAIVWLVTAWSSASIAQTKAYVGNFKDNTVSIVDTAQAKVLATVPVGTGPHGMAASLDGRQVFVGADGASTVSVIDTATDRVIATIEVGKSPHGFAMQPDGRALLVGVYGEDRVAWVDTTSRQTTSSVTVAKPHTIAMHPDGHVAYVASQQPGEFALVVVDVDRHAVLNRIPLEKPPRDLEFDSKGLFLYFTLAGVNAVQVFDTRVGRVTASIPTESSPHVAKVVAGSNVGLVVVQGPGQLLRFDASTARAGDFIRVGDQPHWLSIYDQGHSVAVTNEGSDSLSLVDLSTDSVRSVPVGRAPRKVVTIASVLSSASATPTRGRDGAIIAIRNFAFEPATLETDVGSTVTWQNEDGSPHAVLIADHGSASELLLPRQQYSMKFPAAGTFDYTCSVHPYMSGRIIVTPRSSRTDVNDVRHARGAAGSEGRADSMLGE